MVGGAGADVFVFNSRVFNSRSEIGNGDWCCDDRDVIRDFRRGAGKIDLSGIDAVSWCCGDQSFDFIGSYCFSGWGWGAGQLRYSCGVLSGDIDGDGCADFQLVLEGSPCLSSCDIIL